MVFFKQWSLDSMQTKFKHFGYDSPRFTNTFSDWYDLQRTQQTLYYYINKQHQQVLQRSSNWEATQDSPYQAG